jgi:hypothetical protein
MPQGLQFGNLQFGGAMGDFMNEMNEMNQRGAAAQAPAPAAVQPPAQGAANTPPPQQQPQTPQPQQPPTTEALTRDLQDTQLAVQTQEELLRRMREQHELVRQRFGAGPGPSGTSGANALPTPTQPATTTATHQQQTGLPQGMVLPPGWSVIPLTVLVMPPVPETPAPGPPGTSGTSGTEPTASVSATPTTPVPDAAMASGSTTSTPTAPSATSAPETSEAPSMQQGPGASASTESVTPTSTSSLASETTASKSQSVNNTHRNLSARLMEEAALRRFACTSSAAAASTSVEEAPEASVRTVPAAPAAPAALEQQIPPMEPHTAGPIIEAVPRNAEPIPTLTNPSLLAQQAAASLQATASNSPFAIPTPESFAPTGERLNLFGERSLFDLSAQEGVMRSLEDEVRQREEEWRGKRGAVEGLLGGASTTVTDVTEVTEVERSGAQAQAQEQEQERREDGDEARQLSREEKGKGVDRGE